MKGGSKMFLNILCMCCVCACIGCTKHSYSILDDISSYIEFDSGHALEELRSYVPGDRRDEKAYHAMLLSMALDKNRIDVSTDSIIAPALDYYSRKGAPDERLKTFYYRARIAENSGDNQLAMHWLAKAEKFLSKCSDHNALGRYYTEKAWLYGNAHDYDKSIDLLELANREWTSVGDINRYCANLSELAQYYRFKNNYERADSCIRIVRGLFDVISVSNKAKYYVNLIEIKCKTDVSSVRTVLDEYYSQINGKGRIDYLSVGHAWIALEDYGKALDALLLYDQKNYPPYYATLAETYRALGDYTKESEALSQYIKLQTPLTLNSISSDIRFVEERYKGQIENNRRSVSVLFISILLLLTIMVTFIVMHKRRQQFEILKMRAGEEKERLLSALYNSKVYDDEALEIIHKRLATLEKALKSDQRDEMIELLSDKESFVISHSISYASSHPGLVSWLKNKGLSNWETGYCCLLLMGMSTKEILNHTGRISIYNDSSEIRRKLGIPQGSGLKKFLEKEAVKWNISC